MVSVGVDEAHAAARSLWKGRTMYYTRRLNRIIRTNRKHRFRDYIVLGAMLIGLSASGMVTINAFADQPSAAGTSSAISLDCDLPYVLIRCADQMC